MRTDAEFIRPAGVISALTGVSRVLGLVRDAVASYYFGVGPVMDAFAIGFQVPNLSRRIFGEGALTAAFIPALTDRIGRDGTGAGRLLTGRVVLLLGAGLLAGVAAGELGLLVWQWVRPSLTLRLSAIMLPYALFICVVALLSGASQVVGRFAVPAGLPILFNVVAISGAVVGAWWSDDLVGHIHWLSAAVLLAGVLQIVLQWIDLRAAGFTPVLSWEPRHADIRRIVGAMGPTSLGLAAVQLNTLADFIIAKIFIPGGGGAAALNYAARLYQLPVGIFGVALGTAIFPPLSRWASAGDDQRFGATLARGVRLALLIGVPASAGLLLVRHDISRALFGHGESTPEDTQRIAAAVGAFATGIWAYVLQQVLVRAFYARGRMHAPMHVATAMVALNLVLNLVLVRYLAEAGIALATAISAALQVVILARLLRGGPQVHGAPGLAGVVIRIVAATAVMAGVVWGLQQATGSWVTATSGIVGRLILAVAAGGGVYALAAWLLGVLGPELGGLRRGAKPPARASGQ